MLGGEGGFRFEHAVTGSTNCIYMKIPSEWVWDPRGMDKELMGVKEGLDPNTLSQVQPTVGI